MSIIRSFAFIVLIGIAVIGLSISSAQATLSDLEDELLVEWAVRLPSGSLDVEWDEAGTAHIVVYYARKDHRLPRPDDATR